MRTDGPSLTRQRAVLALALALKPGESIERVAAAVRDIEAAFGFLLLDDQEPEILPVPAVSLHGRPVTAKEVRQRARSWEAFDRYFSPVTEEEAARLTQGTFHAFAQAAPFCLASAELELEHLLLIGAHVLPVPTQERPTKERPTKERPTKERPTKERPTKERLPTSDLPDGKHAATRFREGVKQARIEEET